MGCLLSAASVAVEGPRSVGEVFAITKSVRRNMEPEKILSERAVGDFIHKMRRTTPIGQAAPAPTAYVATALSNVHVAANDIPLCKHHQAPSKVLRLRDAWSTAKKLLAAGRAFARLASGYPRPLKHPR